MSDLDDAALQAATEAFLAAGRPGSKSWRDTTTERLPAAIRAYLDAEDGTLTVDDARTLLAVCLGDHFTTPALDAALHKLDNMLPEGERRT